MINSKIIRVQDVNHAIRRFLTVLKIITLKIISRSLTMITVSIIIPPRCITAKETGNIGVDVVEDILSSQKLSVSS